MHRSLLLFVVSSLALARASAAEPAAYLGQEPPGLTPKIFAPGVVSLEDQFEYGSVFTADGLEFYYGVAHGEKQADIRFMRFEDGAWTSPQRLLPNETSGHNDPFLSPDEKRLFFISNRPRAGESDLRKDHDIWYVERSGDGWGEPVSIGPPINSDANEYYMSFSEVGTLYYSSNFEYPDRPGDYDLYAAAVKGGGYAKPIRLAGKINTRYREADPFVAYDGSYVIFFSGRRKGLGKGDLYVSFRQPDGTWGPGRHMGDEINSSGHELCPFVTKDGRYLFYTSREDIYWVDAAIIETFREDSTASSEP